MTLISARDTHRRNRAAAAGFGAALLLGACAPAPPTGEAREGLAAAQVDVQGKHMADAAIAQADANEQRRELEEARDINASAWLDAQELRRQHDELQADLTGRGLVLTLGDVLFASGTTELNTAGTRRLGKLTEFLNLHPEQVALIEGHTDNIGSDERNQGLSQRRAEAVKSYLLSHGIAPIRLTASGKGASSPAADNGSIAGRQQNRRVEVIIENMAVSAR